ncbi:MAG TPA: alpha/beta fold hydrolase, partial [Gemmatimonadales bacterium]|nr:alpha/beta fold hydrolase [Gemmatimonadales bacterium]
NAPDGTPLVYEAYEPATSPSERARVAVLVLGDWHPQPAQRSDPWAEAGAELQGAGFAAYVLDQRGHGRSGGRRAHLSRFSQLLGDLQAFRRAVRRRVDIPQVLVGQGFGGLVVLRYLETQPGEPPAAAVISNPWLSPRTPPPAWKRIAAKLADLWPTLPTGRGRGYMTAGARAELQWAQRAVLADRQRIERPVLFVLGAQDAISDPAVARTFADHLAVPAQVQWYPDLPYDLFNVRQVRADLIRYIVQSRP